MRSPTTRAPSSVWWNRPKRPTPSLYSAPISPPKIRLPASPFDSADSASPASSTAAHAMPSGYGSSSLSATNTFRIGIMNRIPSRPPVNAISVTVQKSKSCQ